MPSCAVTACGNYNAVTKGMGIKYYKFPKNEDILKQWIAACRRKDKINLKNACICSAHFEQSCFEHTTLQQALLNYTPRNFRNLKPDAVPTLNLSGVRKKAITKQKRNTQSFKRKSSKYESACSYTEISSDSENENDKSLKEMSNIQLNSENRHDTSSDAENEIDIKPVKNACSNTKTNSEYEPNITVPENEICTSISFKTEINLNQPNEISSHSENESIEFIKNTSSNTVKNSRTKGNTHSESQRKSGCKMIYHSQRIKNEIDKPQNDTDSMVYHSQM